MHGETLKFVILKFALAVDELSRAQTQDYETSIKLKALHFKTISF